MKLQCAFLLLIAICIAGCMCHHSSSDEDHHGGRRAYRQPSGRFVGRVHRGSYGYHGYHGYNPYRRHDSSDDDDHHSDSDDHDDGHYGHRMHGRRHHSESDDSDHHSSESEDHHTESEDQSENGGHCHNHQIYRFQIGDNFGAYEYTDVEGRVHGFYIDLMRAVCERANKECYFMVDRYNHCWDTQRGHEYPGVGLLDHYYDGCIGLLPTPERLNSFNFTLPFTPSVKSGLLYKPGFDVTDAAAHNVTGKKIGFVDGWAMSRRCFERQEGYTGNEEGHYTPVFFGTHKEMSRALLSDEIDAMLTVDAFDTDEHHFKFVEPTFSCTLGGGSVMTRYGSDVLDWWNDAFVQMKEDGGFRQVCINAIRNHRHKGRVSCLYN